MGISHPYLAMLSVMVFVAVVTGVSFLYLYIVDQVNRTPVLGVYADARLDLDSKSVLLTINIKHERGRPVELVQTLLYGEQQLIVVFKNDTCYVVGVNDAICNALGLKNRSLLPGSTGTVEVKLPIELGYFLENKTYQGVVISSEGSYPIAFTPVHIPRPLTIQQYPLVLLPVSQEPSHQQCTINRTSRGSIAFTDFESYPITGWASLGGSYSVGPGHAGNALYIVDNGAGVAGASQYYLNTSLSNYSSLWVSVKVLGGGNNSNPNRQDYRHGVVLFDTSRTSFYLVYLAHDPSGGDGDPLLAEPYYGLVVAKYYSRKWTLLSRTPPNLSIKSNGWYTIVVNYMAVSGGLRIYAWLYDENGDIVGDPSYYPLSYTDSTNYFNPAYVGIYVEDLGSRQAGADGAFDDLVISTADPRYVYFEGLSANTTVELWDLHYTKGLAFKAVASGYALEINVIKDVVIGIGGIASINVSFPGEVVCTCSFSSIVGGDSYRVILTGTGEGAIGNVTVSAGIRAVIYVNISRDSEKPTRIWALILFNNSTEIVYVRLVYDNSLSRIEKLTANITLCDDVNTKSCILSALRIVQGDVAYGSTKWLELGQFSSVYLYFEGYLTSGTALLVLYIPVCREPVEALETCNVYYVDFYLNPK